MQNAKLRLKILESQSFRESGNWKKEFLLDMMEFCERKTETENAYLQKLNALLQVEARDLVIHIDWNCLTPNVMQLRVQGVVLETLERIFNENIHITVEVDFNQIWKPFSADSELDGRVVTMFELRSSKTRKMPIVAASRSSSLRSVETVSFCEDKNVQVLDGDNNIWEICKEGTHILSATLNVFLEVDEDFMCQDEVALTQLSSANANILGRKLNTDVVIVASDGSTHSCHACFLSVNSPVLDTMLNSDAKFIESKSGRIELLDVSKDCIKAALEYFYTFKITQARKSSKLAVELFKFAHKYDVNLLEKQLVSILLRQDDSLYDIDTTLELFTFARCLEDYSNLKIKAFEVMQRKSDELLASEQYLKLFTQDIATAMELCAIAIKPSFTKICKQCQRMVEEYEDENQPVEYFHADENQPVEYFHADDLESYNVAPGWN
ncbi:BTB and MATH domain-containing protein 42 [Orchesella cincta]|uniref:BTB and MATH domain-containing protein 42 n=1 Tax=Orchesella cincta TaxID=48709 RepID=A0A1D2MGP0_ORCCI|nr:BTB and MATH domain-containing protein 42 [Orchesella cincta]